MTQAMMEVKVDLAIDAIGLILEELKKIDERLKDVESKTGTHEIDLNKNNEIRTNLVIIQKSLEKLKY